MADQPYFIDTDSDDSFSEYPDLVYSDGLTMDEALAQHYGIDPSLPAATIVSLLDELLRQQGRPPIPSFNEVVKQYLAYDADAKNFASPNEVNAPEPPLADSPSPTEPTPSTPMSERDRVQAALEASPWCRAIVPGRSTAFFIRGPEELAAMKKQLGSTGREAPTIDEE